MENKEQQILSQIMDLMASIKAQMELLETKIAQLRPSDNQEDADEVPIDLDIDDMMVEPFDVEQEAESEPEPVQDPEPEVEMELEPEPEPEPIDDDLPFFIESESEPEPEPEPEQKIALVDQQPKRAVIDSMTDRQAWRADMPGTPVKDIRSAISLNDRILFINMLFGQDPMAFQDALTKINQMGSLDEVVEYLVTERPEWDLESETVYRFMMAVRRKIR